MVRFCNITDDTENLEVHKIFQHGKGKWGLNQGCHGQGKSSGK